MRPVHLLPTLFNLLEFGCVAAEAADQLESEIPFSLPAGRALTGGSSDIRPTRCSHLVRPSAGGMAGKIGDERREEYHGMFLSALGATLDGTYISLQLHEALVRIDFHFDTDQEISALDSDVDALADVPKRAMFGSDEISARKIIVCRK